MKFSFTAAILAAVINASETKENYGECPDLDDLIHLDTPYYQSQSAYCKQQMIWERVNRDHTSERFFLGSEFQGFFEQDLNVTFDTCSDSMPVGRIKKINPRGVVTLMEFIPTYDTPYTGIFRGCDHAVMRISEFTKTTPETPKTAPSQGVKFLRDGMASANW